MIPEKSWANPPDDPTFGTASGSALKSMRQRLCFVGDPVGLSTSWLPPTTAVLPHSVGLVSWLLSCGGLGRAFPA